jgi:hypothetical protein
MWCSNCQSSECPCVQDDSDEDYADYEDFLEELNNKQSPQELEKATWMAENKQLDKL